MVTAESAWRRWVAPVVSALVVALALSLVPLDAQAAKRRTTVQQLELDSTVATGVATSDSVVVSGPPGRKVHIQHRVPGGTWRTVLTTRTKQNRTVAVSIRALRANGRWAWQVSTGSTWTTAVRSARNARMWRVAAVRLPRWTAGVGPQTRVWASLRPAPGLPMGLSGPTAVQTRAVANGITATNIGRGTVSDGYTVTVRVNGNEAGSLSAAQATATKVRVAGFTPRVEAVLIPAVADAPARTLHMVRVGRWRLADEGAAQQVAARLSSRGLPAWADLYADDGYPTTGPWEIHALRISPSGFAGTCVASVGESSATRETTSQMARDIGAVAGVNGGFFDINGPPRFSGDAIGVSVVSGELVSEAVDGRTALVLDGCAARVTEVATSVVVSAVGRSLTVDALNRLPRHDELVLYTDHLGIPTPGDSGFEVVLDEDGTVLDVGPAGRQVLEGQRVLHGRGSAAVWLREAASVGRSVQVETSVVDLRRGQDIMLRPSTHVIGGVVGLVRDGSDSISAGLNGHASLGMVLRRHPRTLAGVTAAGELVLVAVDGRRPTTSIGASFHESAALLRWFGVVDGVSLDGGGSTTMVVDGEVVNTPGGSAERAVGDGLFVLQ